MADRIDENSETWRAVVAWAEERRESCRRALEAPGLPPTDTEYERGRIAAVRELLGLTKPKINTAFSAGEHVE